MGQKAGQPENGQNQQIFMAGRVIIPRSGVVYASTDFTGVKRKTPLSPDYIDSHSFGMSEFVIV
ncbi:hypothetical protein TH4_16345 [Thalassospira tepidiphila MCCC 1A03514]|uniref:Uncharacterized protein n=2 Tax=Thalassospira tepidiphila TaxID=393657 RepID=A0A853KXF5_9PROT|nr:hypothetical protein TH4_16345 [Thalassospira tepidiphila MCCC 1A03514]